MLRKRFAQKGTCEFYRGGWEGSSDKNGAECWAATKGFAGRGCGHLQRGVSTLSLSVWRRAGKMRCNAGGKGVGGDDPGMLGR